MTTIKDVAKQAGVSVCTVSRAISGKGYIKEETRERILNIVDELGYAPNKMAVSLKTGRSNLLALVVPGIRNVYYPKLARYVQNYANEKGYMLLLCSTDYNLEKEKKFLEQLYSQDVSGVMVATCSNENKHIKKLKTYNIPYVYLNRTYEDDLEHCLQIANRKAADSAVSYLISKGHKNIGGLFRNFDNMIYKERFEGMQDALRRNNLTLNNGNLLFDVEDSENSYHTIEKLLKKENRPGAFFASDDMLAYGIYKVAYDLKLRIPQDLSIIGFDNSLMADVIAPHLTTYETPAKELAQLAVNSIDYCRKNGNIINTPILEGKLIIRESVLDCIQNNT